MSWKPEFPEGITPVQREQILVLHCDDTLRYSRSLEEMTADWAFFTIGCIYTYGRMDHDFLAEYAREQPDPDYAVMSIRTERPLFSGMCPPAWPDSVLESMIHAIPLEYWEGLKERIAEISMVDRKRGRFARTTVQELEIVDRLAVDRAVAATAAPPTLTITAFGIDGTHHHVAFSPRTAGPYDRAAVVKLPIREETRVIGKAILAHDPHPLIASLREKPADAADVERKIKEAEEKTE